MRQRKAWEITDEFWEEVKDVLIRKGREEGKEYKWKPGGGGGLEGAMRCEGCDGNGEA